jgi:lipopolysaccharide transport protein LptA
LFKSIPSSKVEKGVEVLRLPTTLLAVLFSLSLFAFNSTEWLAHKQVLMREAERLQGAYSSFSSKVKTPAEDVLVPVDTFSNGSVKTLVTASRAQFFPSEGFVWAKDVLAKDFSEKGVNKSSLSAESCIVDRSTKSGWVQGKAKACHGETEVSGSQVYVSFAENFVMIYSDAQLVSRDVKKKTSQSVSTNATIFVKSEKADYDRGEGVILMDGNVSFDDGEYSLASDKAWVFLSGTNELKRVVAIGSVAVPNGLKRGYCDRVVYDREVGNVVMYARSKTEPARLIDTDPKGGELEGAKIFFRTDAEQVEVDDPVIKVKTYSHEGSVFPEGRGK